MPVRGKREWQMWHNANERGYPIRFQMLGSSLQTSAASEDSGFAFLGSIRIKLLAVGPTVFMPNGYADIASLVGVSIGGKRAGPGDVAMAGGIERVAAFAESPLGPGVGLAQREVIGGDVGSALGNRFSAVESWFISAKPRSCFFEAKFTLREPAAKLLGGFPADLPAQAGFVAGGLELGSWSRK